MLAIKFYSTMPANDDNVLKGISGNVPAKVFNIEIFPNEPLDETFTQMTQEEYDNYLETIQSDLDIWKTIQEENNQMNS